MRSRPMLDETRHSTAKARCVSAPRSAQGCFTAQGIRLPKTRGAHTRSGSITVTWLRPPHVLANQEAMFDLQTRFNYFLVQWRPAPGWHCALIGQRISEAPPFFTPYGCRASESLAAMHGTRGTK